MDQEKLAIASQILSHLGMTPDKLPLYLMDDTTKRTPLDDHNERIMAHYEEDSLWTMKTVRFLKDFSRYKAGIHRNTSNKTFLRTAELFREMGIKNYYFLLQLNNPLLEDVDPWDPNLSDEIQLMILQEAQENVWYILRELIKIDGRRFRANRAVISFIWSCLNHLNTLILMPRQSGKGHGKDSKVLTKGGKWVKVSDLKVGDLIMAWDGTETAITGLYENDDQQMYKITFVDGREVEVDSEHLWTIYDPEQGKGKWSTVTTDILQDQVVAKRRSKSKKLLSIPLMGEDKVTSNRPFQIDPYLLGVLLSSGEFTDGKIGYRSTGSEVDALVKARVPKGYTVVKDRLTGITHIVKTADHDSAMDTDIKLELIRLGIHKGARVVPEEYMTGSHIQRLMLLRGVMDLIGKYDKKGIPTVHSCDKALIGSIQKLVWSLGYAGQITERAVTHRKGTHDQNAPKHTFKLGVRCKEPWKLFIANKVEPTVATVLENGRDNDKLGIKSVEKLNKLEKTICIEVDHRDNLYVMDNWVVTHNTVGMQVMAFIMQYLIGRGFRGGLITLAASNRMQFVNAIKKIRSGLPEFLTNVTYKDKDAGNILSYQAFGQDKENTFEVRVPSGGEDGAENVARGQTFEMLLYDEPAWMKYIENIMNGAGPSTLTAQRNAREKGIPYFTAKATTPNSILKEEGKYMYGEMMSSTEWREAFFDSYSETQLIERVIKASPVSTTAPQICMQFNHLQLGFGKDWVKETMDKLRLSWSKAKIDLLMMWTEEGKNKLFDDKTRECLSNSKREAIWNEEIGDTGLFVDWFITEGRLYELIADPTEFFLMGVDTSDAVNRDACTLVIRRLKTGENIGIGRYPLAFLDDVTKVLRDMIVRIDNSLLIIERNRAAHMIEQLLLTLPALGIDPFKRIFNDIYQDPIKYKNEYRDVQEVHFKFRTKEFYLKHKVRFGFNTNSETRRQMYGFLFEAVANTGAGIGHSMLIDELISLETDTDGRIDHGSKGHDDLVIAWLLSYWFIKLGYNKSLYDIPQGYTLTEISTLVTNPDAPTFSKDQLELFIAIKARIEELGKELEDTDNDIIARRIEMEIKKLSEYIPRELRKTVTVDDILSNANKERNKRALDRRFGRY